MLIGVRMSINDEHKQGIAYCTNPDANIKDNYTAWTNLSSQICNLTKELSMLVDAMEKQLDVIESIDARIKVLEGTKESRLQDIMVLGC
jgi:hypothetical protein